MNDTVRYGMAGLLAAAVVVTGVPSAATVAASPAIGPQAAVSDPAPASQFDPDSVLLRVTLRPNGTAHWQVEYALRLDTENRSDAFESIRADIESDPTAYRDRFVSLLSPSVRRAASDTGREMTLRNVSVSARREALPQETGYVTYDFEWTNFTTREGKQVHGGDALSGFVVDEETTLLITWPASHRLVTAAPEPHETRDGAVVWRGPTTFTASEPRVVTTAGTPGRETRDGSDGNGDGIWPVELPADLWPLTGVGLGTLALLGMLVLATRRGGDDHQDRPPVAGDEAVPDELLSNEEHVLTTLEQHGGRLKQQELAEMLDWTDPKTSRVVGSLRDDEAVEVFRLGRENVVSLPDQNWISSEETDHDDA